VTFQWPEAIISVLVIPGFLWFYIRLEKHRRAAAHRHLVPNFSSAGLVPARPFVRRVPLALFLSSLALLSLALARPQIHHSIFALKGTAVLAVDVSTSMKANDAQPSRLAQSQELAREFVAKHSDERRIGLVSFAGNAVAELDPTTGREELFAAIDRLTARPGTAIGTGIVTALSMLFPEADIDMLVRNTGRRTETPAERIDVRSRAQPKVSGTTSQSSAMIVLITDGQSAHGSDPIEAARLAAELGVRVHTIGVGSVEGKSMTVDGWSMRVQLNEGALKEIATTARGKYFRGRSGIDWQQILESSQSGVPPEHNYTEVTALFAALAALIAVAGALASLIGAKRIL